MGGLALPVLLLLLLSLGRLPASCASPSSSSGTAPGPSDLGDDELEAVVEREARAQVRGADHDVGDDDDSDYDDDDDDEDDGEPDAGGLVRKPRGLLDWARRPPKEWDFVVVGGGAAGAALASRLSEEPSWTVLLVEAGGEEERSAKVPFHVADLLGQRRGQVWPYSSEPDKASCRGLRGGRCPLPRGRGLGGSTAVGYMLRTRPPFADFRRWQQGARDEAWGPENTLRYFKKAEDQKAADRWPGFTQATGGPVPVSDPAFSSRLSRDFLDAAAWLGYRVHHNDNGTVTGFTRLQTTVHEGSRFSAAAAYLGDEVHDRPNLRVETGCAVTRILWRGNAEAAGVEVRHDDGELRQHRARKEVVLAAGAVNTPQILMLSGVGPAHHLQSLGIPVLRNLPVGQNLQDHVGVGGLVWTLAEADEALSLVDAKVRTAANTWQWLRHGRGPLAALLGGEAVGFVSSGHNPDGDADDSPDLALVMTPTSPASVPGLAAVHRLGAVLYDTVFAPLEGNHTFTITPMVLRPKSRGRVLLRSKDPADRPVLQPGYLTHPQDVAVALEGVSLALHLGGAPALRRHGARLLSTPTPGCEAHPFATTAYWECQLRTYTVPGHNMVGTCKMGVGSDAVVDGRLRVLGTSGLRVADASVVPDAPAALLESVVTMVAEMAGDLIKKDWGAYRRPPPPGFPPPPPGPDPFLGTAPAATTPATTTTSSTSTAAAASDVTPPSSVPAQTSGPPAAPPAEPTLTTPSSASGNGSALAKRPQAVQAVVDYREPRE